MRGCKRLVDGCGVLVGDVGMRWWKRRGVESG